MSLHPRNALRIRLARADMLFIGLGGQAREEVSQVSFGVDVFTSDLRLDGFRLILVKDKQSSVWILTPYMPRT